jgi:hypothetical protein
LQPLSGPRPIGPGGNLIRAFLLVALQLRLYADCEFADCEVIEPLRPTTTAFRRLLRQLRMLKQRRG